MIHSIALYKVQYLPTELEAGVLYYSKKFGIAGHLCPCGCGSKVITPIDSFEWRLTIKKKGKPSLFPSVGNWQLECKSHYWIINGKIEWSEQWSDEQIAVGFEHEEQKRRLHFRNQHKNKAWTLLQKLFKQFKSDRS